MRGLLLLGTDTAVGKTTVAEGLLRLARRRRLALIPFKPVETGRDATGGDAARLLAAAEIPGLELDDVCPWPFELPVAPSVAAELGGRRIDAAAIQAKGRALGARGDALLVESAGGLLTPYASRLTSVDLSILFGITVLLISANRLGTINHTALALAELRRRRIPLAGFVLVNVSSASTPDQAFNPNQISVLTGIRPLGVLRHCCDKTPDAIADAITADIDTSSLLDGALA